MEEIICNLHIHSKYSDGTGSYDTIVAAAAQACVDVVIVTDHNILVQNVAGYIKKDDRKVLLLSGEEVHDQGRVPQKNHLLVFGVDQEMAHLAGDPQRLIDTINKSGGSSFIAHPDEYDLKLFHEDDISWINWDVKDFTGFELWNGMSEFKSVSRSFSQILKNAFFPELVAHWPLPQTLKRWDDFLTQGRHLSVVGGTDAHALHVKLGPFTKVVFPYKFHFSTINNHLLLDHPLSGDVEVDKRQIFDAIKKGSSYIGYDLPASTRGFSFRIESAEGAANIGESMTIQRSGLIHVKMPQLAEMRIIHNGKIKYQASMIDHIAFPVTEPGAYRIECYKNFLGLQRGWIFSNPIYLSKK